MNLARRFINKISSIIRGPQVRDRIVVKVVDGSKRKSLNVETIEKRQGLKVACVEKVAYRMGYINSSQVEKLARPLINNRYGQYLLNMVKYDVREALRV